MNKRLNYVALSKRILLLIFTLILQNNSLVTAQSQICSIQYGDAVTIEVEGVGQGQCKFEGQAGDLIAVQCGGCDYNTLSILDPSGHVVSTNQPLPTTGSYTMLLPFTYLGELSCGTLSYTSQVACENNSNAYCDQVGGTMFGQEWCPTNAIQQTNASGTIFVSLDHAVTNLPGVLIYSKWFGEETLFTSKVYGIYKLETDGSETRLTQDGHSDDPDLSPDKSQILYVVYGNPYQDDTGQIYIMDANGDNPHPLTQEVNDSLPKWSPDGKQIVFASDRTGTLDIYVMNADGSNQRNLTNTTSRNRWPIWSPDGQTIYFQSNRSGSIQIYSMKVDGSNLQQLTTNNGGASNYRPMPSPDGTKIAFASDRNKNGTNPDGSTTLEVYVMNIDGSNQERLSNYQYEDIPLAWSPDSKQILYFSDPARLMVMNADGTDVRRIPLFPETRASGIASWVGGDGSGDSDSLTIGNPNTIVPLTTFEGPNTFVWDVAWSPDGKELASANTDATVYIWDVASGKYQSVLNNYANAMRKVVWSPDGKRVATASDGKAVSIWDPITEELLLILQGHTNMLTSVAWSPDGKTLASTSFDQTVRLWDSTSGTLLNNIKLSTFAHDVAWSPDSTMFVVAEDDPAIIDAITGKTLNTLRGHNNYVIDVAWSPDGKTIASADADNTIRLWNVTGGETKVILDGSVSVRSTIAWSPNSKLLAGVSVDGSVKIWDAATGHVVESSDILNNYTLSVAWSPDGTRIATGDDKGSIQIWVLPSLP